MSETKWTPAQRAAIDDRGGALLVSAAAGSGKTAVLTERAVRLITDPEHPVDADRLLIVTFTNAAAAELRARIGQALLRRSQAEPGNTALRRQRMLLQRAPICTIDAFCLDLLHKHFQALDIPPDFTPADPGSVEMLRNAALSETLEAAYQDADFCAFADLYGKGRTDKAAGEAVLQVYDFLRALPDYDKKLDGMLAPWQDENGFARTCWHDILMQEAARSARAAKELLCAARNDCREDFVTAQADAEASKKTPAAKEKAVAAVNEKFAEPLERLENSAALLLPRAPAAGKRILLEYLTPLWKRMSFSQKTTARNLFRYKKRFFMTVLGVAGCTALLLIGFGIQDSLLPMLTKQTTELTHADLTISLSDEKALTMENGLADLLDSSSGITSWGRYYTKSVTLYNAEGEKETVSLVAAADESQMTEYFTFRTRQGHKAIAFDDSSVILTEKTAEKLGLSVGDSFEVETTDGGRRSLTLTGITENYVFTRLYLSQAQLKTLNGGALPAWNAVYGQTDCPTDAARASLSSAILACNYVSSVSFIEDTTQMFDGLIGCLNYVVMLVIVCAAALAAVVLYNLISVNLGERKKELATIKVLGFYDKEVYRYIFREIDLLSLIGSLVGLVVGIPLHQFIIRTVEMDQMMFIRSIAPRSFVFSVALTMLFNFAVCLLMRRHVRQISMVESMKAPE